MMYPFLELDDGTEIVHSERLENGSVKVYVEKPDAKDCFHSAVCWLPQRRWENVEGFTREEIEDLDSVVKATAHLIMEFSETGGFDYASGF